MTSVDKLSVGETAVRDFSIEAGALDVGFQLDGILGMDFLLQASALIDLHELKLQTTTF
jgi:hypothetical protein